MITNNENLIKLFPGEFEFIDSGFSTGLENMRFDSERVTLCSKGLVMPMLRVYGWSPWAVSLGANQNEDEINHDEAQKRNIDIVRRPTGGRAVLHADELTYSVVLNLPNGMAAHDAYREIHLFLMSALEKLGCELGFVKSKPDFRSLYKKDDLAVSCFASSARYEIEWEGRKVVGSAQRLFGKTLLQHGSILLGSGHEQLAYLISNSTPEQTEKILQFTDSHSATLTQACGKQVTYQDCSDVINDNI
ncbi:MAG: biotin/lipoate protein ligase [Ignavibacteria bacterium]|nr:biotin/lipoate protein ligase [Ignavibacteria bacterium]